jgi:hypothetical protein
MKYSWIGLFGAAVLCSCITVREGGLRVEVVKKPSDVKGCRLLDEIEGSSVWGDHIAFGELQNQAGDLDADKVLLTQAKQDFWGYSYQGRVYKCSKDDFE